MATSLIINSIKSAILKKDGAFLIAHQEKKISKKQVNTINFLVNKYKQGWPLAYLLNSTYFYHLKLKVRPGILIPRPETEIMLDLILEDIKNRPKEKLDIIDLGTGSGAIILVLSHKLKNRQKTNFLATDISPLALSIAKENAKNLKLSKKIKFIKSDLLKTLKIGGKNVIIAANLPYLNNRQLNRACLKKEPKIALAGGSDGLDLYRRLFKQIKQLKTYNNLSLYLEINPEQNQTIRKIIKKTWPKAKLSSKKDLRHKIRFVLIKIKN